jgi:hypothetical protein
MDLVPAYRRKGEVAKSRRAAHARVTVTPVAWRAQANLALEEWLESGRKLGLLGRNVPWWIGDWLRYGNHAYGERYVRAARVTGYDTQTLMNMVYVASRFQPTRRRGNLSWSHHAEVTALDPAEQDAWLDRAEAERMSVRCLRQEIRGLMRSLNPAKQRVVADSGDALEPQPTESSLVCPSCGHTIDPAANGSAPEREHGPDDPDMSASV